MEGRRKDQTEEECLGWVKRVRDNNEKKIQYDFEGNNDHERELRYTF